MSAARYCEDVLLGTGGMAEVWRAKGPEGMVALKRLLPHAARNRSMASAFEREGRLLARIRHPNVVGIHQVLRDERGVCLVLEYVDGADLRALVSTEVPWRIALRIVRDVLHGLQAVHDLVDEQGRPLGLVHRDLSPGNVLVSVDGRVKLTDFGIARALSGSHATTGQDIKGTLAYLSPEQATQAPIDGRSDLFSVGAILYELFTGAPIYDEDDPRVALARARAGDVHSVGAVRPDLPLPIIELVDRALAAAPSDRFASAAMMRAELERAAEQSCGFAGDDEIERWSAIRVPAVTPPDSLRSVASRRGDAPIGDGLAHGQGDDAIAGRRMGTTLVPGMPRRRVVVLALCAAALGPAIWFGLRASLASDGAGKAASSALPPLSQVSAPGSAVVQEPASPPDQRTRENRSADAPAEMPVAHASAEVSRAGTRTAAARAASSARAPATSAELGLLDVGSEPGFAYVTIDGVKVGATPLFGRSLSPGTHQVKVWREGLGSKTLTVEIRPGERVSQVVKLP